MRDDLAEHPDRHRWNARYAGRPPSFQVHDLAAAAALILPDGPVLELACGPSGSALAAAAAGRRVTAVDVSDVALRLLGAEAERRGLRQLIDIVHADLEDWRPAARAYALVLCTGYWDREVFGRAAAAVAAAAVADAAVAGGGVLAWQALTAAARVARPGLPAAWCLGPGEPAAALPDGFTVIEQSDLSPAGPDTAGTWRRLLARRRP
jgi:SAM-dependent methyltransferase